MNAVKISATLMKIFSGRGNGCTRFKIKKAQTPSISKRPTLISTGIGSSLCLTVIQTISHLAGDLLAVQIPVNGNGR
ncbi:Uncharacterised protein [Enterobacter hormaechei]|nr:Uncharacterised protein [Enterobacter hormaechei]SAI13606.1 Uncharacterised protein [Enterobacter hormaechei]